MHIKTSRSHIITLAKPALYVCIASYGVASSAHQPAGESIYHRRGVISIFIFKLIDETMPRESDSRAMKNAKLVNCARANFRVYATRRNIRVCPRGCGMCPRYMRDGTS